MGSQSQVRHRISTHKFQKKMLSKLGLLSSLMAVSLAAPAPAPWDLTNPFSNPVNDAAKEVTQNLWSMEFNAFGNTYSTLTYERIGFVWTGQIVGGSVAAYMAIPPNTGTISGDIMSGIIWDNFRQQDPEQSQYYRLEQIYLRHPIRNNMQLTAEWNKYVNDFIV